MPLLYIYETPAPQKHQRPALFVADAGYVLEGASSVAPARTAVCPRLRCAHPSIGAAAPGGLTAQPRRRSPYQGIRFSHRVRQYPVPLPNSQIVATIRWQYFCRNVTGGNRFPPRQVFLMVLPIAALGVFTTGGGWEDRGVHQARQNFIFSYPVQCWHLISISFIKQINFLSEPIANMKWNKF